MSTKYSSVSVPSIRAELISNDTYAVADLTVETTAPVLALCPSLIVPGKGPESDSRSAAPAGILALRAGSAP